MPRNNGSRPRAAAPSAPALRRSNTTTAVKPHESRFAAPPAKQPNAPPAQPAASSSGGDSIIGNIASTAAGVAIGHTIGNAVSGWFGGSSDAPEPIAGDQTAAAPSNPSAGRCDFLVKELQQCIDTSSGPGQCRWIFDQLNVCQRAAANNE